MTQSYKEYLSEIEFEIVDINCLTEEALVNLETKTGYVIEDKFDIYLCKKFEPVEFYNQLSVMEKTNEFYVIDMMGVIMFEGSVEKVIEFAKGFLSKDETP